jgi:hypothetical protein
VVKAGKGAKATHATKAAKATKGGTQEISMSGRVSSHSPFGITVDGVQTPLEGEPPVAKSHGWGNLSWGHYGY